MEYGLKEYLEENENGERENIARFRKSLFYRFTERRRKGEG